MYLGGIVSEGIEAFFPLTPKLVLMMIDGSFHTQYASQDRRYMEITNRAFIERYNKTLALQAERAVFSINGEFDLLQKMKEENPNVFNQPQIQLRKATEVFNTIVN